MSAKRLRYVALALGAAWASLWGFFEAAEAFGDRQFGQAIFFLVAMFGVVAIAWKWPVAGAALFLAEGLAAIAMFAPLWMRRFPLVEFLGLFAIMPLSRIATGIVM